MKKSDVLHPPTYFDTYLKKVSDIKLSEALQQSLAELDALDLAKLRALGDQVYAPGKWTVRDVIQHLTDCEQVFNYRALRFARNDKTELPGFDENLFAEMAGANSRSLEQVLADLRLMRQNTIAMFRTFDEQALRRTGVMTRSELPVLALGFISVGHQNHHFGILEERYFPLLEGSNADC